MADWAYIEGDPSEKLEKLHFFAMTKQQSEGEIQFRITIHERASNPGNGMQFFAEADKQTNQSTAPFTPCGWGRSLPEALGECIRAIHRFPYEGALPDTEMPNPQ